MTDRSRFVIVLCVVTVLVTASFIMGQGATNAALKNPAALKEMAPATYKVDLDTSVGMVVIEVRRE